jgi:hypothetical protein
MASTSMKAFNCLLAGFVALAQAGPVKLVERDVPDGFYVPSYYPAPYGGWVDSWAESYEKAKDLVDQMTLAEKTNITAGSGIFMGMHSSLDLLTLKSLILTTVFRVSVFRAGLSCPS